MAAPSREFEPWQFAYHFLSRSITDSRLARRAPDFVRGSHRAWARAHGAGPLDTPFETVGWRSHGRLVAVVLGPDGVPVEAAGLALLEGPPVEGPWGARLRAPRDEADLPATFAALTERAHLVPALVAVHGGTPLTRTLVCERARMHDRVPALLCDPEPDRDRALTTVLSGRADLVGYRHDRPCPRAGSDHAVIITREAGDAQPDQ